MNLENVQPSLDRELAEGAPVAGHHSIALHHSGRLQDLVQLGPDDIAVDREAEQERSKAGNRPRISALLASQEGRRESEGQSQHSAAGDRMTNNACRPPTGMPRGCGISSNPRRRRPRRCCRPTPRPWRATPTSVGHEGIVLRRVADRDRQAEAVQASQCSWRKFTIACVRWASIESIRRRRSRRDIGLKVRAKAALRSMNSVRGIPTLHTLTGKDSA